MHGATYGCAFFFIMEEFKKNRKKNIFHQSLRIFRPKVCSQLTPSNFENANKPKIYKILSILVVLLPALLKLFLYGNIVCINSTIYGAMYGLHGGKKKNLVKAFRVLKILFLSNFFCYITPIFLVFQRKKIVKNLFHT